MKIRSCPFCGSTKAYLTPSAQPVIKCPGCGAFGPQRNQTAQVGDWVDKENAITDWNKRVISRQVHNE